MFGFTYFIWRATFWERLLFQVTELLFQSLYVLKTPAFLQAVLQELIFQKTLFFRTASFRLLTLFSQLHFLFII